MGKNKLNSDDLALFRQAMKGVKPLKQGNSKMVAKAPAVLPRRKRPVVSEPVEEDRFSDFEFLEPVASEQSLVFARSGISSRLMRSLRRGDTEMEAVLDLHGKTVVEARLALHRFLLQCRAEGRKRVLVVHGKGRPGSRPILKNKLNHWLRESEVVLAFCSAGVKDGGVGAVYLLLKSG